MADHTKLEGSEMRLGANDNGDDKDASVAAGKGEITSAQKLCCSGATTHVAMRSLAGPYDDEDDNYDPYAPVSEGNTLEEETQNQDSRREHSRQLRAMSTWERFEWMAAYRRSQRAQLGHAANAPLAIPDPEQQQRKRKRSGKEIEMQEIEMQGEQGGDGAHIKV